MRKWSHLLFVYTDLYFYKRLFLICLFAHISVFTDMCAIAEDQTAPSLSEDSFLTALTETQNKQPSSGFFHRLQMRSLKKRLNKVALGYDISDEEAVKTANLTVLEALENAEDTPTKIMAIQLAPSFEDWRLVEPLMLFALADKDATVSAIALGALGDMKGTETLLQFVSLTQKLPPEKQFILLPSLVTGDNISVAGVVLELVPHAQTDETRQVLFDALGRVDHPAVVAELYRQSAQTSPNAALAKTSLLKRLDSMIQSGNPEKIAMASAYLYQVAEDDASRLKALNGIAIEPSARFAGIVYAALDQPALKPTANALVDPIADALVENKQLDDAVKLYQRRDPTQLATSLEGGRMNSRQALGFIIHWYVLGPFSHDYDLEFGSSIKLGTTIHSDGTKFEWQPCTSNRDGALDLSKELNLANTLTSDSTKVAYALAEVKIVSLTTATLHVFSLDPVDVWVNGSKVEQGMTTGSSNDSIHGVRIPIQLKSGFNQLLFKTRQTKANEWTISVRLLDKEKGPLAFRH